MTDHQIELKESEKADLMEKEEPLKPYLKPYLEEMGDLRNLTLGPSPGIGESGFPMVFKA
jgi:hypothetical protein